MKTFEKISYKLFFLAVFICLFECQNDHQIVSLPVVETIEVSNILQTTASSGGTITNNGNAIIMDKGICWDVQPQPTISLTTKTSNGQDVGVFISELSNLIPNQTYHVRAYATNSAGTAYGNELIFQSMKSNTIIYKNDGRSVSPITLDMNEDGLEDFRIFTELIADDQGDHLYVGIKPIGPNQIKSGPVINENFLNMGLLISENLDSTIDENLEANQNWISDPGALVKRNTFTNGEIQYEGNWSENNQILGIQNKGDGFTYFGWLRINFDKETEKVTLVDYAYESISNQPIKAGQKSQ